MSFHLKPYLPLAFLFVYASRFPLFITLVCLGLSLVCLTKGQNPDKQKCNEDGDNFLTDEACISIMPWR